MKTEKHIPKRSTDAAQVSISLSKDELTLIDTYAEKVGMSRSEYIRKVATEKCQNRDSNFYLEGYIAKPEQFIANVRTLGEVVTVKFESTKDQKGLLIIEANLATRADIIAALTQFTIEGELVRARIN
jgi:hypothetical protein